MKSSALKLLGLMGVWTYCLVWVSKLFAFTSICVETSATIWLLFVVLSFRFCSCRLFLSFLRILLQYCGNSSSNISTRVLLIFRLLAHFYEPLSLRALQFWGYFVRHFSYDYLNVHGINGYLIRFTTHVYYLGIKCKNLYHVCNPKSMSFSWILW